MNPLMNPQIIPAFGMPAGMEWLVILVIALLLFGSRLPSMMRGMGGSIKEFKKGMEEGDVKGDGKDKPSDKKIETPDGAVSRDGARPADDLKPHEKN